MQKARPRVIGAGSFHSAALLLAGVLLAGVANAAPWEFEGGLDAGAIFTDNLTLASDGLEDEEVVFTIAPTLRFFTDGERLEADLRYRPEAYFYDDRSEFDEVFHTVDMSLTGALVRNALFVYANATNFQSIATADERIPTSNVPVTGNRINARIIEVRPYWERNLGFAEMLVEVAQIDTDFDEFDLSFQGTGQDNVERRGLFRVNNYANQQGLAWGLRYEHRRVEYNDASPWDYQRASADLGYWVNSSTRLFVSGGLETDFRNFLDSGIDADIWEVGFQYAPSQRMNLEIAGGRRSYGNSYRADFSYELRRGRTSLTYSEQPTTIAELLRDQNPILDTDNLNTFLSVSDGSDRFILKRGEWLTTIELAKSDISLRAFFELRDQRTDAMGIQLGNEDQTGVAFRWSWRLGARSTLGFYADHAVRSTAITDADITRVAIDYEYDISQRLSIVTFLQRTDESADNNTGLDYTENQIRLLLRANF